MSRKSLLTLCLFASSVASFAQPSPKVPDTASGRLFQQYLQLCNAADTAGFAPWGEKNLTSRILQRITPAQFAARESAACAEDGGYQVSEILRSDEHGTEAAATARKTGAFVSLRLELADDGKVRMTGAFPAVPPENALKLGDKELASSVERLANALNAAGQFSGVVTIAKGDKPIVDLAIGFSDRTRKTPLTTDSRFTLGSMSKMWTAAGLAQQVDAGKLSFDDTVGKFFPNFANATVRDKVTVGMLLSHTSGMGNFLQKRTPEMMKNGVQRASDFIPLFEKDELLFEPGARWSYSNSGLALAGAILEKVSGEAYPDYLRKHILQPLGMNNSDPNNIPHADPRLVTPYTESREPGKEGQWEPAQADIGSPAGGAISTAHDLIHFANALRSGRLVKNATLRNMASLHGKTPFGEYGYAMELADVYGQKIVGHGGGFPGVSTHLYIALDGEYTAVVLANQDPPAAERLGEYVKAIIAARTKAEKK